MKQPEQTEKSRPPLRAILLKHLRAQKLGLSHPLVVAVFSQSELDAMRQKAEQMGSIIIDDLGPIGRLDEADIEELRLAIVDAEEAGFRVPEGIHVDLFSDEIRTLVNLTLDPDSVERRDFRFEASLIQGVAEKAARSLEKKLPGLEITFEWSGHPLHDALRKIQQRDSLPDWWGKDKATISVSGMPVGVRWNSESFLKSCLGGE